MLLSPGPAFEVEALRRSSRNPERGVTPAESLEGPGDREVRGERRAQIPTLSTAINFQLNPAIKLLKNCYHFIIIYRAFEHCGRIFPLVEVFRDLPSLHFTVIYPTQMSAYLYCAKLNCRNIMLVFIAELTIT